jgi:hypothetical protein
MATRFARHCLSVAPELRRPHLRSNVLDATATAGNGSTKTRVRCRIL